MVNFRALFIAAGALAAALMAAAVTHTEEIPKRAPYSAVRWPASAPEVKINGEWVSLASVDGVAVSDILAHCRTTYGERWRKRFEEDLVEAMTGMGREPGERVTLVVRDLDSEETQTLEDVAMTLENRQAIWLAANGEALIRSLRGDGVAKLAPYGAIRWEGDAPVVRIAGEWLELLSIDGVATGEIVRYCQKTYDDKWRKRFEEDLVEAMTGMGHSPGETVELVVQGGGDGERRLLKEVAMTREHRQAIWYAAQARSAANE